MKVSTKIAAYAWRFGMTEQEYFKYQAAECDPYALGEEELARRHDEERETLSQYFVARHKATEEENRKAKTREAIAKAKAIAAEEKARMTDETRKRLEKTRAICQADARAGIVLVKRKAKATEAAWISRARAELETGFIQRG